MSILCSATKEDGVISEIEKQKELTDEVYHDIVCMSASGELTRYTEVFPEFSALCRHYISHANSVDPEAHQSLKHHIWSLIDKVNQGPW